MCWNLRMSPCELIGFEFVAINGHERYLSVSWTILIYQSDLISVSLHWWYKHLHRMRANLYYISYTMVISCAIWFTFDVAQARNLIFRRWSAIFHFKQISGATAFFCRMTSLNVTSSPSGKRRLGYIFILLLVIYGLTAKLILSSLDVLRNVSCTHFSLNFVGFWGLGI